MIAYFDSSAFAKLVLEEHGTEDAREFFVLAARVRSSRVLAPETCAAVARARRSGRVTSTEAKRTLGTALALLREVEPIELDADLARRAGEIAFEVDLRGYDAVHLASYELISTKRSVLIACDGELIRVARGLGHAVAVPGS